MTVEPGLCRDCRHGRAVPGRASTFWLCRLSETDGTFPRYPRLPVLACRGFAPDEELDRRDRDAQ